MKIAVTGATGFIGQALCPYLSAQFGDGIIPLNRQSTQGQPSLSVTDAELVSSLSSTDCLIHLAARAHTKGATAADFTRDNQELCARIARIALAAKVPRVIYLSSIKVNGESTNNRQAFSAEESPAPEDAYGKSKLASEQILQTAFADTTTELVIIRPPLVYGRHNKGNLAALERLIKNRTPLPFAAIHNQRDLISQDNLCSLIALCCHHPQAAGQIFLASDGISRSTADIVRLIAQQAQRQVTLFSLPVAIFKLIGLIAPATVARLTGDLQVDISQTKSRLGWSPR